MGINELIFRGILTICITVLVCFGIVYYVKCCLKKMELNKKLELEKLRKEEKFEIINAEMAKNAVNEEVNGFVKQFNEVVSNELKEILDERLKIYQRITNKK